MRNIKKDKTMEKRTKTDEIIERIVRLETKLSNGLQKDIIDIKEQLKDIGDKIDCMTKDVTITKQYYNDSKDLPKRVSGVEHEIAISRIIYISGIIVILIVSLLRWALKL